MRKQLTPRHNHTPYLTFIEARTVWEAYYCVARRCLAKDHKKRGALVEKDGFLGAIGSD